MNAHGGADLQIGEVAPKVLERLVDMPDIVLEPVMRRSQPNGWGDQIRVLAPTA